MTININKKSFLLGVAILLLGLGLMVFTIQDVRNNKRLEKPSSNVEEKNVLGGSVIMSDCRSRGCTGYMAGSGGCIWRTAGNCYASEYECPHTPGLCCDRGVCDTCEPCSGNYQTGNNGCSLTPASCDRMDCYASCGTNTSQCYPVKYTLSYSAGTGGSITGTTNQSVCYNTSGTQVTAVANSGYAFSQWSDGSTSASRSDVATTNKSFTASFIQTSPVPTKPTSLLTNGQTNPTGVTTPQPYFSAIYNHTGSNNGVYYEIHVNTQPDWSGTYVWNTGKTAMTSTAPGSRSPNFTYAGQTLQSNTTYYWAIRFWDTADQVSSWGNGQFTMGTVNHAPTTPTGLLTNGLTNPTGVTTPQPYFSAIYNHTGSSNGVHYEIHVNTKSDWSGTYVWVSGKTAMTSTPPSSRSPNFTYAGQTLQSNTTYYWVIRFWDTAGQVSNWGFGQFTMGQIGSPPNAPTAPLTNGYANPVGIITPQPYFSAMFNDPDSENTGVHYQIQVNTNSSFNGTTMWDSTKTAVSAIPNGSRSPNITYAGSTLQEGSTYYWRIRFWDNTGLQGAWSSVAQFTMNTTPTAPTVPLTNGLTNPTDISSAPYFSAVFNDADSTNEGKHYRIEVNTNSSFNGTTMWDSGKTSMTATAPGSRSPNINYAGNALSYNGTTYYWRIMFWDNVGVNSPWSATAQFTTSLPGAAPTSLRTNNLTDPTNVLPSPAPYFTAIFNHSNPSRRAVHYQIIITKGEATFWDSGKTSMTSTAPGDRCPNITYSGSTPLDHDGSTYLWNIAFWDDLGVKTLTSADAQFTMNLRPTPPTGLLTEGLTNPSGVTDTTPEFSAIYNNTTGKPAVHYQIQVNTKADFTGTMKWDSGQVSMPSLSAGSRSSDITYAGSAITQNGQTYFWRIRFWDNLGGDGQWSAVNYFTMHNNAYTYTISPAGAQESPILVDKVGMDYETYMGGVYSFTVFNVNPGFPQPRITSITLERTWVSGSGEISEAILFYSSAPTGESCPTIMPESVSLYGSATDPYKYSNAVTISGAMSVSNTPRCVYVAYRFADKSVPSGSVLDFQITNFGTNYTGTKFGLPANISGTSTFSSAPDFLNMANNGPKDPGGTITFTATANDADGDNVKLVVCKTPGLSGQACNGGDDDTYCTSSFVTSNPSCSWDIPSVYPDGSYYAYPYVFDSTGLPSEDSLQGAAHTFSINNVAPLPTQITINNGEAISLIAGSTKSVALNVKVRDNNGCTNNEIDTVKAYMYRSGITGGYSSCDTLDESNANNCYPEIPCTFVSCSGTQGINSIADYTCTTNLQHYTDPTDSVSPFPEESWIATVKATDNGFGSDGTNPLTGTWGITNGVPVNSLLAFNITQELNYGTVLAGQPTSPLPSITTITSAGNIALNHSVSGNDMCEDYPTCEGSTIGVEQQKYSLNSTTDYPSGTVLTSTPTNVFTNLAKQTTSTPTSVNIWWGILAPLGTAPKQYSGQNTITSSVAH